MAEEKREGGGELVCNVCSPQKLQRVGDEAGDGDKGGGRAILKQLIRSMASKPLMCPSTPRGTLRLDPDVEGYIGPGSRGSH